jgi:hypothetical protein
VTSRQANSSQVERGSTSISPDDTSTQISDILRIVTERYRSRRGQTSSSSSEAPAEVLDDGTPAVPQASAIYTAEEGGGIRSIYTLDAGGRAVCRICGRNFTVAGFSNHCKNAHPVEYNGTINVSRVKAQWSVEEEHLLALKEAQLLHENPLVIRKINQELRKGFPHRTIDAIKCHRKIERFKILVQEKFAELQVGAPVVTEEDELQVGAPAVTEEVGLQVGTPVVTEEAGLQVGAPVVTEEAEAQSPENDALWNHLLSLRSECKRINGQVARSMTRLLKNFKRDRMISDEDLLDWVKLATDSQMVNQRPVTSSNLPRTTPAMTNKERKRQEYAKLQKLLKKDPSKAAQRVLEHNDEQITSPDSETMLKYWSDVFNAPLISFNEEIHEAVEEMTGLWDPIKVEDVKSSNLVNRTSSGIDGVKASSWNSISPVVRTCFYTVIMIRGYFPEILTRGRTIFIPKKVCGSTDPKAYRPITISSVILRQFNRILADRMTHSHNWDERQRAFLPVDGCAENLTVLQTMLHNARLFRKELHIASIDLSKAFDSVVHAAVVHELKQYGAPPPFIKYIQEGYKDMRTVIQYNGLEKEVAVTRGVRQGDPLSSPLFNLVIENSLRKLNTDVGFKIDQEVPKTNAIVFADDTLLVASTPMGLQHNLDRFVESLSNAGFSLNVDKCSVLSLKPSGRDKKTKILTESQVQYQGQPLKQVEPTTLWKYLGVEFKGCKAEMGGDGIVGYLDKISKAPLRPQQRVSMLKDFLIPKYIHTWVLGRLDIKMLKRFDMTIRAYLRKWLRLPHDVPVGFFHAAVSDGGLGIPSLAHKVPALRIKRLERMKESNSPVVQAVAQCQSMTKHLDTLTKILINIAPGGDTRLLEQYWAKRLHSAVDGKELKDCNKSRASTHWVEQGSHLVSGGDYVHLVHTRINCLPSLARCSRGRPNVDLCRAGCGIRETTYHIVQECGRTHGGRVMRHDKICDVVAKDLSLKGWRVVKEPRLRTVYGLRKPDLICIKNNSLILLDAQVTGTSRMYSAHTEKRDKYMLIPQIEELLNHIYGADLDVSFLPVTLSWRGLIHHKTVKGLQDMGVNKFTINTLVRRALLGSFLNFRTFNMATYRVR